MKALVISGGGSKGAFAGGVAEYLINECGNNYDLFVGSSTGSLLASHLALGKIAEIKEIYTNCTQRNIFNINPFSIKRVGEKMDVKINHFNTLRAFIRGKKTFGESKNLRKLIKKGLTRQDYNALRRSKKEVIVAVSNLTTQKKELKSNLENDYHDFVDWIWASANYVPFMSLLSKNGFEYADGGFSAFAPIQAAIDRGATSVDVIILETKEVVKNTLPSTNAFSSAMKVFSHMMDQIYHNDLAIGQLKCLQNNVDLRLFHVPRVLTNTPLVFEPDEMKGWWQEGFEYAQFEQPFCQVLTA